jgi:D-threo-aldose 1-dehydrogenase
MSGPDAELWQGDMKGPAEHKLIGLGGAGLGNLYRAVSDHEAKGAVHAALASGFGLIDTAPYYGHGRSEMRIGAALRTWRGDAPLLSTKVGRVLDPVARENAGDFGFVDPLPFNPKFDYSREGVKRSLADSFERLGVERIDIALIHDIGSRTHGAAHPYILSRVLDETLPQLEEARSQGLLDAIGIGVNEWEICIELLERARIDRILLAGRYTLLEQPALTSGLLDLCRRRGVRVYAGGVFNSGLLATRPSRTSTYNYAVAPREVVERAGKLWETCEAFGVAPQAAALQFPLFHPAVAGVIVGARSAAEVADAAAWRQAKLPIALWDALKRDGFIAADAPIGNGTCA